MVKLTSTTAQPKKSDLPKGEAMIGQRLKKLREIAGLSQVELSTRMKIDQTALSRLERSVDIQISTLKKYVEAVGTQSRIDATFSFEDKNLINALNIFEELILNENQIILSLFSNEESRPSRDFVLSIKPKFSSLILKGTKKVELRRRFPTKVSSGALAFIYSTSPEKAMIGTAKIDSVEHLPLDDIWQEYSDEACIEKKDFETYFAGLKDGYVLRVNDARPLPRIVGLEELRERFDFKPPQSFLYAKPILRKALDYERSENSN